MEVSDLLISKPGGLTTAEALVKELPLGIVDSLAGQERRNKQLLLRKEIAFELNSREAIIRLISNLKDNSFDLESWRKRARKLACPRAAEKIAQTVIELVKNRI
jgi:processive 1,2-diacylglycerol beta-glucosyltransferase